MARLAPGFLVPAGITDGLWELNLGFVRWTVYGGPGDDFVRITDHVENQETGTPIVVRQVFAPHPIERLVIPLWLGDTEHVPTPEARP
jgi:hypothetical protein